MSDCERKGKIFGGCEFKSKFDVIPPTGEDLKRILDAHDDESIVPVSDTIEAASKRIYVGDVCATCGLQVLRQNT